MVEARFRKGFKPSDNQLDKEVKIFLLALEEQAAKSQGNSHVSSARKSNKASIDQWLKKYLNNFEEEEREKLVIKIMDYIYDKIKKPSKNKLLNPEWVFNWKFDWAIEALTFYKMLVPFVPKRNVEYYKRPLKDFYFTVIVPAAEEDPGIEELKLIFSGILEV